MQVVQFSPGRPGVALDVTISRGPDDATVAALDAVRAPAPPLAGRALERTALEATALEEVAEPETPERLAREVAGLSACHTLYASGDYSVLVAQRQLIPTVMNEIGRLRELSFRSVGEGTGKARDIDAFDDWYMQLFVWQRKEQRILGAYRLCMTDVVRRQQGDVGLYTKTLFTYDAAFLDQLGPAIELGRSFVRLELQGAGRVLALLWRGIGHLISARPRYRTLFGPVSVSSAYSETSRQLIATRLCQGQYRHSLYGQALPRRPLAAGAAPSCEDEDVRTLTKRVSQLESDQKGLPILIREYVKLGGQFLAFSVDPDFQNAMDGLVVVNLERTAPRLLALHMGQENYERFRGVAENLPKQLPVARREGAELGSE
jgi:putative hemolysin